MISTLPIEVIKMTPENKAQVALLKPYSIQIDHVADEDGGGFLAYLIDFGPYTCGGTGDTIGEALRNLEHVKREVFTILAGYGTDIPEPSPPTYHEWTTAGSGRRRPHQVGQS